MIPDVTQETAPPSVLRLRFSLLALLVFVTLVCLLLAWWVQPRRVAATALFEISSQEPSLFGNPLHGPFDESDFELFKKTQLALLKSSMVIDTAVRSPGIATLPLLAGRDPANWLQERLEVDFPQQGEILSITLRGPPDHATDLVQLVDAVAKAYQEEVVFAEMQRRGATRDLLARTVADLNRDIQRKWQEREAIGNELGIRPGADDLQRRLHLSRLERLDVELLRLEAEQLALANDGDTAHRQSLEERITQLQDRQKELEAKLMAVDKANLELTVRQREIERLQQLADELAIKVERMDVEANAPPRIRKIQSATISSN